MLNTLLHQTGVQKVQSMYTRRSKEKFGIYILITSTIVGFCVTLRWCVGGQEQKAFLSSGN